MNFIKTKTSKSLDQPKSEFFGLTQVILTADGPKRFEITSNQTVHAHTNTDDLRVCSANPNPCLQIDLFCVSVISFLARHDFACFALPQNEKIEILLGALFFQCMCVHVAALFWFIFSCISCSSSVVLCVSFWKIKNSMHYLSFSVVRSKCTVVASWNRRKEILCLPKSKLHAVYVCQTFGT